MISIEYLRTGTIGEIGVTTIYVDDDSLAAFRAMVQRAVNLWPEAPADIKNFADKITNGKAMQNYFINPHLSGPPITAPEPAQ